MLDCSWQPIGKFCPAVRCIPMKRNNVIMNFAEKLWLLEFLTKPNFQEVQTIFQILKFKNWNFVLNGRIILSNILSLSAIFRKNQRYSKRDFFIAFLLSKYVGNIYRFNLQLKNWLDIFIDSNCGYLNR